MKYNFKKIFLTSDGFNLVEVVIVIFITAIISGLAFMFSGLTNKQKLNIAATMIAENIRLTQQLNLNQDGTYAILFDCSNEKYYIRKCEIGVPAYKVVELPTGIDLVGTNFDFDNNPDNGFDHELRFNPKGEPFRKNGILCGGHLSLRDKNKNFLYVIVASVTGRVRIDTKPPPS